MALNSCHLLSYLRLSIQPRWETRYFDGSTCRFPLADREQDNEIGPNNTEDGKVQFIAKSIQAPIGRRLTIDAD